MLTASFYRALLERAIKTFAQSLGALLIVNLTPQLNLHWQYLLATAGLTTLASILTTLGTGVITQGNASLATGSEVTTPPSIVVTPNPEGTVN